MAESSPQTASQPVIPQGMAELMDVMNWNDLNNVRRASAVHHRLANHALEQGMKNDDGATLPSDDLQAYSNNRHIVNHNYVLPSPEIPPAKPMSTTKAWIIAGLIAFALLCGLIIGIVAFIVLAPRQPAAPTVPPPAIEKPDVGLGYDGGWYVP